MQKQLMALRRGPDILLATPGRLIDHLQQKTIKLDKVGILVLDEADRMLDMGFAPQLKQILVAVPKERQTMLFSATMPENIVGLAKAHMKLPLRIEMAPPGTAASKVTQELFFVSKFDKPRLLEKVLNEYKGSVLIFCRTKFGAKRISYDLARFYAVSMLSAQKDKERLEKYRGLALTTLEEAIERGFDDWTALRTEPDLAPLRVEPRYKKLLEREKKQMP